MVEKLVELINNSRNIVFFGGAGVSTASGIPDFRSNSGLFKENPEYLLSDTYYQKNTKDFFDFYRENMIYLDIKPNITHEFLVKLENIGKLKGIITQNIDGLHQLAGSKKVIELHGNVYRNYCEVCKKPYGIKSIMVEGIPRCVCGGTIRPDVTLYEENLNMNYFEEAQKLINKADLIIVAGTSLVVYPAASLIGNGVEGKLVLINKTSTNYDYIADILLKEDMNLIFKRLNEKLFCK